MKKATKLRDVIESYFQVLIIFTFIFIIVYFFVGQLYEVTGDSMLPNFHDKEQLIAEKLSVKFSNLERGDVIVFKNPRESNRLLIKRIIGLPGEKIQITDASVVYINGEMLNEPYLKAETLTGSGRVLEENFEYTIPSDSYVVMGDNREQSTDSREWGYVKSDTIIGRAILVYYPLKSLRILKSTNY